MAFVDPILCLMLSCPRRRAPNSTESAWVPAFAGHDIEKNKEQVLYTLYQTRLEGPLIGIREEVFDFDGLHLTLWQEDGVFYGLAGPTE